MKPLLMIAMVVLMLATCAGCGGSQAATLAGGDAIKGATVQLREGVVLYDQSVQNSIASLKASIRRAAEIEFGKVEPEGPKDSPEQRADSLMKVIDNLLVEEERRSQIRTAMNANIDLIEHVANELQKLAIYSSSVDVQVRDWMKSQIAVRAAAKVAAKGN